MSLWALLLVIFAAGAIGGIVNALLSNNGFVMPKAEKLAKRTVVRPGLLGNILISGVAACVSWGLYGPFASASLIGGSRMETQSTGLTLAALVGAVLVGIAGARWLTNEIDKTLLRVAASEATNAQPNPENAKRILEASPIKAARIATGNE